MKIISMQKDTENNIASISIGNTNIKKSVSLGENKNFLDENGQDIVLDFDESGKLVNIELIGFL